MSDRPEIKGAVLITGAAARIGRELAIGLSQDGWAVAIHYNRSQDKAEALLDSLSGDGIPTIAVEANLTVSDDLNTLIERSVYGLDRPLTALINNASTFAPDLAGTFTRASYDSHMEVNLYAALKLSQDFAAQCPPAKGGAIINMLDQRVLNPGPEYFTYSLSKAALHAATTTLAQSLAPHIRVNALAPGPTLPNPYEGQSGFDKEVKSTLLGRGSPPDTLLEAVRYLLGAKSVTGQTLTVDGGQHLA